MPQPDLTLSSPTRITFAEILKQKNLKLTRTPIEFLQINVGKLCNQVCLHCHVEAGPKRTEIMEEKTANRLVELLAQASTIHTVDLTGGAPELNTNFKRLVTEARKLGKKVIDRCNLTVFYEKGQEETPEFLAENHVSVVASLPCYSQKNVDQQRGKGVFGKSIQALQKLNSLGYGKPGSKLELSLVYNPVGPYLPPPEAKLEKDYKEKLKSDFGIEFSRLYTITNMPIKRFLVDLKQSKQLEAYMTLLVNSFNPTAAMGVMCRNLISIGWDGQIYDCDFNQMLEMPIQHKKTTIWDIKNLAQFDGGEIEFADHCFGCTAGAGSSCGGSLT